MSSEQFTQTGQVDRLDADAVCAQCGTVNPEGTLICKVCGNNLRDQRTLRLSADQELEGLPAEPSNIRKYISGTFGVLGIILLLVVTLNANTIAEFLVTGVTASSSAEALWIGPESAQYRELRQEVMAAQDALDNIEEIMAAPVLGEYLDGVYAVIPTDPRLGEGVIATVAVRETETSVIFTAVFTNGVEVRGHAQAQANGILAVDSASAAALVDLNYLPVYGYVQPDQDGYFIGFGQSSTANEELYAFRAYYLP